MRCGCSGLAVGMLHSLNFEERPCLTRGLGHWLRGGGRCALVGWMLLVAVAGAQSVVDPVTQTLKWHWQVGKTYVFRTDTETTMSLVPLGGEGEQTLQIIQTTEVRVKPGDGPGVKELAVRFLDLRARLAVGEKVFHYASDEPSESDPALRQMLSDSTGFGFTLRYTMDDQFIELGAVEQTAARPDQEPSLLALADARQVADLYRRSLEMALPRPAVAVGDKWISVESMAFPQAGQMDVKMNCHFVEEVEREERRHAKVTYQGKIGQKTPSAAPAPVSTPTQRAVSLAPESMISGQLFFDLERRVIALSVFLGSLVVDYEGTKLPVRQSVSTRLEDLSDSEVEATAEKPE